MTFYEYEKEAMRTMGRTDLSCAALGLCGEAGEFADLVKKHVYHGHEFGYVNAAKELGDILWYLALAAKELGLGLDQIATMNVAKLKARYPNGFTTEASKAKADEVKP